MRKNLLLVIVFAVVFQNALAQKVGITDKIGGITPVSLLQVHLNGTSGGTVLHLTDDNSGATLTDGFHLGFESTGKLQLNLKEDNDFEFYTNGNERMIIKNGGIIEIKNSLQLDGSTSGYVGISSSAATTSYSLTLPSAQGSSNSILTNNGSGVLSWSSSPAMGNSYITPDGGLAVKLIAGESLVRGNLVRSSADGKVYKTLTATPELVVGVVYADALQNAEVWVVTTGQAYVLFEATTTNAVWAGVSNSNAGKAYILTTIPPGNTEHDREIGHPIETIGSAGLAKCIIHFR